MRVARLLTAVLLAVALMHSESGSAETVLADTEGWHTWQVEGAGAATDMCCFTWRRGEAVRSGCNLDNRHLSVGHHRDCSVTSGPVQYYVRIKNGRPADIMTVIAACPVTAASAITDHGVVPAKDNIAWFRNVIEDRGLDKDVREEALFGLVQSGSDEAFRYLDRLLSRR